MSYTHSNIKSIKYSRWLSSSSYWSYRSLSLSTIQPRLTDAAAFERRTVNSKSSKSLRSSLRNSTTSLDLCFNVVKYWRSALPLKKYSEMLAKSIKNSCIGRGKKILYNRHMDIPPVVKTIFHNMWLISSSLLHTWLNFAPFSVPTARFYALRLLPGLAITSTQTPIS